eukprot:TRINITY_DN7721_c1_g1_i1.p1 TRINITY_DN7721_c1_g1~~TRINITY_DN7721_c1_g1_i1.p1  ORF type:complete len:110 (+),score=3.20 TRINITY_DN7721_c1_g1_i1:517-846(+)
MLEKAKGGLHLPHFRQLPSFSSIIFLTRSQIFLSFLKLLKGMLCFLFLFDYSSFLGFSCSVSLLLVLVSLYLRVLLYSSFFFKREGSLREESVQGFHTLRLHHEARCGS